MHGPGGTEIIVRVWQLIENDRVHALDRAHRGGDEHEWLVCASDSDVRGHGLDLELKISGYGV
jgi:hypothetical protein